MPVDRFYFDGPLTENITLEGPEFQHMKVLRINVGETMEIVNGRGSIAKAAVTGSEKYAAHLQLSEIRHHPRPALQLTLAVPLLRMSKLELIFEKCTELDADAFYLYAADHSEKPDISENQLERLRAITISALKQCGRLFLPTIEVLPFAHLFQAEATILYGDPDGAPLKLPPPALFLSGPEKGFSDRERTILQQKATGIKLNPNVLRAETAPIAATSILMQTK
jgi:16S rRNA (uracil1498-N3)-methyltransferase